MISDVAMTIEPLPLGRGCLYSEVTFMVHAFGRKRTDDCWKRATPVMDHHTGARAEKSVQVNIVFAA